MKRIKVGLIGCGQISSIYLKNCTETFNDVLEVYACADLVNELAIKRAEEYNIQKVYTVEELLSDPEIDIVLNLTAPIAHAEVNLKALHNGKHVYTEKPYALNREDANQVLSLAQAKGLLVGCAPDTFLGGGLQTCRKLIDDGWIGTPYAATGLILMGNASDGMHPNFENFLQLGGDPMFDMCPYYITALVSLFGPIRRVTGSTQQLNHQVTVKNPKSPRFGDSVMVKAPMNVSASFDFHNGVIASLHAAKESFGYTPRFEIYGTEGILIANDPNFFGGSIQLKQRNGQIKEMPYSHDFTDDSRGLGLADMAYAVLSGRPHRASGQLAAHVLDVMLSVFESSSMEQHITITSECERPAPLPLGLKFNQLD